MKTKTTTAIFVTCGAAVLLTVGLWPRHKVLKPLAFLKPATPMPSKAEQKRDNEKVIATLKSDPKPESQDKVGEAEMRLAYLKAESNDFESSRKLFLDAAKIKGTGAMGPDFGGINDQAAYQAIVCLVAEHKEAEAKRQFRQFIKDHELSPLAFAAERRLVRMNGGKPDPNDEALLQKAVAAQEKVGKFETAVCGPKTLEYLLKEGLIKANTSTPNTYQHLATLTDTTERGSSIDGMRKGLKQLGIESYGIELNRPDLDKLPLPAILLDGDHYFAILERNGLDMIVYDTLLKSKRKVTLPKLDDTSFRATVIAFDLGRLREVSLTSGPPPKTELNKPAAKVATGKDANHRPANTDFRGSGMSAGVETP